MKVICSLSGLEFETPLFKNLHIPVGETYHPFLDLPESKLNDLYSAWLNRSLTAEESYLLFVYLLKLSKLVLWRAPIQPEAASRDSLVACNMQKVFRISSLMASLDHPYFVAPQVIISEENCDLDTIGEWVILWQQAYADFIDGLADAQFHDALMTKQAALEKFIKSPQIPPEKYAHVLADWAAMAVNFPPYIAEYWKELIVRCHSLEDLISIPTVDLSELIEHCEQNLDEYTIGSIFSNTLYTCLSEAWERKHDFFGTKGKAGFIQIDTESQDHKATLEVIASAPVNEPTRNQYVSEFEYRKAIMSWRIATKYTMQTPQATQAVQATNQEKDI